MIKFDGRIVQFGFGAVGKSFYEKLPCEIKFDENKAICIPFDAIVNVYIYNADQLKRVLKLKKYPAKTLVIEKTYSKEYISLQFFDEDTIHALIKELQKARGFA